MMSAYLIWLSIVLNAIYLRLRNLMLQIFQSGKAPHAPLHLFPLSTGSILKPFNLSGHCSVILLLMATVP